MLPQVIFINDSSKPSGNRELRVGSLLPKSACARFPPGSVRLSHGLFRERRELVGKYALRLETEKIFQNHLLEAGVRIDTPCDELHRGWEEPHCQLRGHFAGHWLSAMSAFSAMDGDRIMESRVAESVELLKMCQERNGGQWAGSIPEKYFSLLESGIQVWSPQYTVHKTMAGLLDAFKKTNNATALEILDAWTDWFYRWCERLTASGKSAAIYQGECAGMLELWADLYGVSGDERHLDLARWYCSPDLFQRLLDGEDPLSNTHANASIPWILGAARIYETCGDERFRLIVEAFWKSAVTDRGMFATSGANAGEYWIPGNVFSNYLGERTQEHCTVYNMMRVAQYLYRWSGESAYADYVERALYNGVLAQQNAITGMVCYFLPLAPGARKKWGGETSDFWCCHGTLVQVHAMHEELIYHKRDDGISVDQFIPSRLEIPAGVRISQTFDWRPDSVNDSVNVRFGIESDSGDLWALYIRKPSWLAGDAAIEVDGDSVESVDDGKGFFRIERAWRSSTVTVSLPKKIKKEFLPGSDRLFALVDGPVVLAALTGREETISGSPEITPVQEHQYVGGREWRTGHYSVITQAGSVRLKPLYEITDEEYSVYFREK